MSKFHVNPANGKVSTCTAQQSCPFGGEDIHGATREDAAAAYEKYVAQDADPETNSFSSFRKKDFKTIAKDRVNPDGSARMPAGHYTLVSYEELNPEIVSHIIQANVGEMETKPLNMPDGSIAAVITADFSTNGGYYGDVLLPNDSIEKYVKGEISYPLPLTLNENDSFKQYDVDGEDHGLEINGKRYSTVNGETLPGATKSTLNRLPKGPAPMWDDEVYSHVGLDEAVAQAEKAKAEGRFVAIVEEHVEERDELDEPYEDDYEDYDEYDVAYSEYSDAIQERGYEPPNSVNVQYTTVAYNNRAEFEKEMKENMRFNGTANTIITFNKAEDFDGMVGEFDNDTHNNGRGVRGAARVFFDPEK